MATDDLDPADAAELVRRADALGAEAARLIEALRLPELLGRLGHVEHIGSSATGLMVWREIDLGVRCRDLTPGRAWDALRPLLVRPGVTRLDYRDETGARSPSGLPSDQRYAFVVHYEPDPEAIAGAEWKLDLSLWRSDAPRNQLAHVADLRRRLTPETRVAILRIKDVWHRRPTYPHEVGGTDVYDAVLEHGVRTPDGFAAYLRERGLPVGEPPAA